MNSPAAQFWSDLESQEAQRKANRLHKFLIVIGNRNNPRVRMEVYAESRAKAAAQHEHLVHLNERFDVLACADVRALRPELTRPEYSPEKRT